MKTARDRTGWAGSESAVDWPRRNPAHKLTMPYFTLLIAFCCAVFYYRLGEAEYRGGWLLALISVVLSVVGLFVLQCGWLGYLLLQAGLFAALWVWNMASPRKP